MNFRAMKDTDLAECLAIDPRSTGEFVIGRGAALEVWSDLIASPSFTSAVIEAETKCGLQSVVAFGASLFLTPECANRAIQEPGPDCNSRVFSDIHTGKPVIRTSTSMSGPGDTRPLDLLLLCSSFRHDALHAEQQAEVSALLPRALVHLHAGYRIGRILMETTSEPMRAMAASSGLWKTIAAFPEQDRALMIVTDDEIQASAGFTVLAPLFRYRAPRLGLRSTDKHLLAEALHGETDTELAARLHLSISSVKKRWASLFSRVAQNLPELLPELRGGAREETRGLQKRNRVLTYVRSHPEELRPFRSYPAD